jgi:hypothetical protein
MTRNAETLRAMLAGDAVDADMMATLQAFPEFFDRTSGRGLYDEDEVQVQACATSPAARLAFDLAEAPNNTHPSPFAYFAACTLAGAAPLNPLDFLQEHIEERAAALIANPCED